MRKITSKSVKVSLERNRIASLHLINMLPPRIRSYWRDKLFGSPTDKIAEIVMAYKMKGIATDSTGYDIELPNGKIEVKFSFISNALNTSGSIRREAKIGNLKTKHCDLIVVCIDADVESTHKDYLQVLHLPVNIWKQYWTKDSRSLTFGPQHKWYKDYRIC